MGFCLFAATALWLSHSSVARAQSVGQSANTSPDQLAGSVTLSVSPATAFISLKPGATTVHTITITNKSQQAITLNPRLVDFVADGQTGTPQLLDQTSFTWIANSADAFAPHTIPANQQAAISLILHPPANTPTQEYHLSVLFEQQRDLGVSATSTIVPVIASNLVVFIEGEAKPTFGLSVSLPRFPRVIDSFRPLTVAPLVKNESRAAAIASGSAIIRDWRGRPVAQFQIYPDVILAESSRELRGAEPAAPVLPDDPTAAIATKLTPILFTYKALVLVGPYTLEFNLIEQTNGVTTTHTQRFDVIAFPFSGLFAALTTLLLVSLVRTYQRHRQSQAMH